ncbi:MAG: hypothetical protein ACOYVD_12545 [Bacillota bacterium]
MDRDGIIKWIEGYCRLKMAKENNKELDDLSKLLTNSIRNLPLGDNTMVDIVEEQILKIQDKIEFEKKVMQESANSLLKGLDQHENEVYGIIGSEMKEVIETYSNAQDNLEELLGKLMCLYDLSDVLIGILPAESNLHFRTYKSKFYLN